MRFYKFIIGLLIIFTSFFAFDNAFSLSNIGGFEDLGKSIDTSATQGSQAGTNKILTEFGKDASFVKSTSGDGLYRSILFVAKTMKNLFIAIAIIYYLIIVIRQLSVPNAGEEFDKFKKGVFWVTAGIIVMQLALVFVETIAFGESGESAANRLFDGIVMPMINFGFTFLGAFFILMCLWAFFQVVISNGDSEKAKTGQMTIVYAILGFLVVKFADLMVRIVYGFQRCKNVLDKSVLGIFKIKVSACLSGDGPRISEFAELIVKTINWVNGFLALVIIIIIMWMGFKVMLFGARDEETMKKFKRGLLYIFIGVLIIFMNYAIVRFFIDLS